jgi:hypothetical protein
LSRQQKLVDNLTRSKDDLSRFCADFFEKFQLRRSPKNLEDIYAAFTTLKEHISKGDLDASFIGKYVYEHISREDIRTRRVTARDFEEFLTTFFEGELIETEEQRSKYLKELPGRDDFSRRVSRNRLEKLDVRLGSLLLSVKTFVPTNLELNAGSFSAEGLFDGFLPLPIPNERTDLGSAPALKQKFEQIEKEGKWKDFVKKFETMINTIYLTDWIFGIKGGRYLDIYVLDGAKFKELMIKCVVNGPSQAVELLNRFEAHAIRTRLEPFLSESRHVRIDLIGPANSRLQSVDNLVSDIRSSLVASLCGRLDLGKAKQVILEKIEQFFAEMN